MKVIREPRVYLIGKQVFDTQGWADFCAEELGRDPDSLRRPPEDSGSPGEELVEASGRLCYFSYQKGRKSDKDYIHHILESGHGSVTEHAIWTLFITGISRSCSHELVRHRHAAYSQLSQRYVDESIAEYVEPDIIANDPELHDIWESAVAHSHNCYLALVDRILHNLVGPCPGNVNPTSNPKVCHSDEWRIDGNKILCDICGSVRILPTDVRKHARQAARSVLPNATETKISVTLNARAARNALELRCSRHAETEIRKLFNRVYEVLLKDSPNLFGDYQKNPLPDGTFELLTEYRKV